MTLGYKTEPPNLNTAEKVFANARMKNVRE
jgi:hypothetical protein